LAAVEDEEDTALDAEIGRARAAISKAVIVGNLTADPVSKALEAMSLTLAAQLALHKSSTRHLRAVSDRLDTQVADALALAGTELRAKKADMIATLTPQLAGMVQEVVRGRLWTIKLRAISICTAAIGLLVVALGAGGYRAGSRDGRQWAMQTASTMSAAIERDGPGADRLWTNLVANNDLVAEMVECRKTTVQEGRRHACSLPVWLDPPDTSSPSHAGNS
jgi:hypothetical protein